MKIGLFTEVYPPYISGVSTSVQMLKEALEKMHHTVYVVTANLIDNKFKYDAKERIIYLPGIKTGIYETKLTTIYSKKALKIIKEWDLDVIHSQTEFGVGTFSRIVAKKLNIPVVHTYHTIYEDYTYYITHNHFKNLSKKLAIKLTKFYCDKKCNELIVPTLKIATLLKQYGINKNIHIIPTGIDTEKFIINKKMIPIIKKIKNKYKIKDTDFVIGNVGRVAQEKNLIEEIKAFKELLKYGENYKLMIVGDGPLLKEIKNLVKKLDIEKNVIFTGKVKYELMSAYYNTFNVMISFSTTETQGLTIIEGLAASLPVVAIYDEAFTDMVTSNYNGLFFHNTEEFIQAMIELKNNKTKYKEFKTNAKNSIYKYSKEVFAGECLKVYFQAIKNYKKS